MRRPPMPVCDSCLKSDRVEETIVSRMYRCSRCGRGFMS
jgi:hypothetical protein